MASDLDGQTDSRPKTKFGALPPAQARPPLPHRPAPKAEETPQVPEGPAQPSPHIPSREEFIEGQKRAEQAQKAKPAAPPPQETRQQNFAKFLKEHPLPPSPPKHEEHQHPDQAKPHAPIPSRQEFIDGQKRAEQAQHATFMKTAFLEKPKPANYGARPPIPHRPDGMVQKVAATAKPPVLA